MTYVQNETVNSLMLLEVILARWIELARPLKTKSKSVGRAENRRETFYFTCVCFSLFLVCMCVCVCLSDVLDKHGVCLKAISKLFNNKEY